MWCPNGVPRGSGSWGVATVGGSSGGTTGRVVTQCPSLGPCPGDTTRGLHHRLQTMFPRVAFSIHCGSFSKNSRVAMSCRSKPGIRRIRTVTGGCTCSSDRYSTVASCCSCHPARFAQVFNNTGFILVHQSVDSHMHTSLCYGTMRVTPSLTSNEGMQHRRLFDPNRVYTDIRLFRTAHKLY